MHNTRTHARIHTHTHLRTCAAQPSGETYRPDVPAAAAAGPGAPDDYSAYAPSAYGGGGGGPQVRGRRNCHRYRS